MSGTPFQQVPKPDRPVALRVAGRVAYWLAVFVLSLAILYGLIRYLESRDNSQVAHSNGAATQPARGTKGAAPPPPRPRPANSSGGGGSGGGGTQQEREPSTLGPAG